MSHVPGSGASRWVGGRSDRAGHVERTRLGHLAQTVDAPKFTPPWVPLGVSKVSGVVCNVCRWQGADFVDPGHCERTACPRCNSIGRDRFLFHCWMSKGPMRRGLRVLETSPRLGPELPGHDGGLVRLHGERL